MRRVLIIHPSWEDRAYLGLNGYLLEKEIAKVVSIEKENSLNISETQISLLNIDDICSSQKVVCEHVLINDCSTFEVLSSISSLLEPDDDVIIDITTMSRNIIWLLVSFMKCKYGHVNFVYNSPKSYCDGWISREPSTPSLLLKHSGIVDLDLQNCLIIITGFDTDRTKQLVRFYEPHKIVLMVQVENEFNNNLRNNIDDHKSVCLDLGFNSDSIDVVSMDSYAEDFGYSVVKSTIGERVGDFNIIVASLGPKLSAISLYRVYLEYPQIALAYVPCKQYNPDYCKGIGGQREYLLEF